MTDPIWSFYLFWLPNFFKDQYKISLKEVVAPMVVIYLIADIGSIFGGWLSSRLIKRGKSVNVARKTALFVCALGAVPTAFIYLYPGMWTVTIVIGIALAAHQGFSSNLYTLVSDMFPRKAVGSVAGVGGTFGYIGTSIFMAFVGWVVTVNNKNYLPIFLIAATGYLIALLIIHVLAPRMQEAQIDIPSGGPGFDVLPPAPMPPGTHS